MRKSTGNHGGLFSRSMAGGLVLLLVLTGLPGWQTGWPPAAAARKIELDWPGLQVIRPGTRTTVLLYQDQGPRGDRKVRGLFHSATEDSITLKLEHGPLRTFQKAAIRKVLVNISRGWTRVQAVKPGARTTVVLYTDQAPQGRRRIKGRFQSATDDSLTLQREDGQRHTFQKSAVRKVLTRRPIWQRYQVWATLGISTALFSPLAGHSDIEPGTIPILIGLSTLIALIATPAMARIYNAPRKHRTQPPADKPSGAEGKAPGKQKNP